MLMQTPQLRKYEGREMASGSFHRSQGFVGVVFLLTHWTIPVAWLVFQIAAQCFISFIPLQ